MPIRLVIADDHPMLVDGLKKVLEEMNEVQIAATAHNGWELVDILRKTPVDMVLLDLQMPKLDGIDALKIVKKEFPKLKIIVFTNYGQAKLMKEIIRNGPHFIIDQVSQHTDIGCQYQ